MSLEPVEPHMLATVVTSLEMLAKPRLRAMAPVPFRLTRWKQPGVEKYRALFRRVGEPWLWFSRLVMTDDALAAIIHDPAVEIYAVEDARGIEIGMLELDFRIEGETEIGFFGLIPELAGKGHGNWLMGQALALGWRPGIKRLWVHTCTLDHPGALRFYVRNGFQPFARAVEIFVDPRVAGVLTPEMAPHVPMLQAVSLR
ncbi:MAG: GCN5-related N-acetyltransferase [Rhizorhabdus sp.]|nr:GCN5-related N-acetyltransferase [Rhizorhabdus sp.]